MTLCERCNRPREAECDGSGLILIEEGSTRRCRNMLAQILVAHLGPEFAGVRHVRNSPLFTTSDDGGPPLVDKTTSNMFLTGPYQTILSHMKWALALKGPSFHFQIITDERIKNVFVGAEAYKARPRDDRDDEAAFNSLPDLVNGPQLLIIRLGQLGYKNVAAAGALKEALLIRAAGNQPTWLIESIEQEWTFSKDFDVRDYVEKNFEILDLNSGGAIRPPSPVTEAEKMRRAITPFTDEELGIGEETDNPLAPADEPGALIPEPQPRLRPVRQAESLDDWKLPGEETKKGLRR